MGDGEPVAVDLEICRLAARLSAWRAIAGRGKTGRRHTRPGTAKSSAQPPQWRTASGTDRCHPWRHERAAIDQGARRHMELPGSLAAVRCMLPDASPARNAVGPKFWGRVAVLPAPCRRLAPQFSKGTSHIHTTDAQTRVGQMGTSLAYPWFHLAAAQPVGGIGATASATLEAQAAPLPLPVVGCPLEHAVLLGLAESVL